MSLIFFRLPILYVLLCAVVVGLTVGDNSNAFGQVKVNSRAFFTSTERATIIRKRLRNTKNAGTSKYVDGSGLKTKSTMKGSQQLLTLRRRNNDVRTVSTTSYPTRLSSSDRTVNKTERYITRESVRKIGSKIGDGFRVETTTMDFSEKRKKPIGDKRDERGRMKRKKMERIINNRVTSGKDFSVITEDSMLVMVTRNYDTSVLEERPLKVLCGSTSPNESSLSLRSLFHVPRARKAAYCTGRKHGVTAEQRYEERGQSSAVPVRSFDRGHTELINEYENERSIDVVGVEYVHPEGHIISPPFPSRRVYTERSIMRNEGNGKRISADVNKSIPTVESNILPKQRKKKRGLDSQGNRSSSVPQNYIDGELYNMKAKRATDYTLIDYRRALSERQKTTAIKDDISGGPNLESAENIRTDEATVRYPIKNSSSELSMGFRSADDRVKADTPWPLVPGPISCDLDFQLRPSFVAKLGEFDYVVSIQRQQNPDIPGDHACTGVVYNPRFVLVAPHCLHDLCDNYGLTVASTDDLCTIDETIQVDYVIEHENYDAETRKNDIALVKLKSEIHKKPATFSKEDGTLGKLFYAVGFGELLTLRRVVTGRDVNVPIGASYWLQWKSYPTKISKLLQKMPVQRYTHSPHPLKEAAESLYITSTLDLTGALRGDFGGALINPQGELVGLKSKLVKKSTGYEVYTRVRAYLPWIESMVALHGLW